MRLPRAQFTMRRMMIAVAVLAIILGIGVILRRRHEYRTVARIHRSLGLKAAASQRVASWKADRHDEMAKTSRSRQDYDDLRASAMKSRSIANWLALMERYHFELGRKYEEAVSRPWRLAPPDPIPPPRPVEL